MNNNLVQPAPAPKKKSKLLTVVLVLGGFLSVCCIIGLVIGALSPSTPKTTPVAEVSRDETAVTEQPVSQPQAATEAPAAAPVETEPAQPTVKDVYLVGEKAEAAGIAITVLNVQKVDHFSFTTPDSGNVFLDVEVLIENISRDEDTPYNSMYFKVKDSTAAEYNISIESLEPSLKTGDLKMGDKARGHIAFEVPANGSGFVISYEPLVLFGGYETIRVNLEQQAEGAINEPGAMEEFTSQVGQRFESAGIAITVQNAQVVNQISSFTPSDGMVFLDIEVLIENVSRDEETPYNPLYFKIKDNQYLEYNTAMASLDPSLTAGDMVKADKVRGHVAFEVPANAKQFVVTYEPLVLFGGYETIAIQIVLP